MPHSLNFKYYKMTPLGMFIIPAISAIIGITLLLIVIRMVLGIEKREQQLNKIIQELEQFNKN